MNYHPQTTQAYPAYAPTSQPQPQSQSQPQQPAHAPYPQQDPYPIPRRDPFYPSAPQHVRHSSQGSNKAPQGLAEGQQGQGGWPGTGTEAPFLQNSTFAVAQYQVHGARAHGQCARPGWMPSRSFWPFARKHQRLLRLVQAPCRRQKSRCRRALPRLAVCRAEQQAEERSQMREAIACMGVLHDTSIAKSTSPPIARGVCADADDCTQMLLR